jgi:hypothetical protein
VTGPFKGNNPSNHFLLVIYGLLLYWPMFYQPLALQNLSNDSYLFDQIMQVIQFLFGKMYWVFALIVFLLFYMQALLLNYIATNQRLFQRPNFLVSMIYLLFSSFFLIGQPFGSTHIILMMLVFLLYQVSLFQTTNTPGKTMFNTGLMLGVLLLIDQSSFVLIFLPMIGLAIMRPFRLQEWFIIFLGLLTPLYLQASYLFIRYGQLESFHPKLRFEIPNWELNSFENVQISIILLVSFIGFYFVQSNRMKGLIQSRNTWSVILSTGILSFIFFFLNNNPIKLSFGFLLPILAFFGASAFYYAEKGWFRTLMHLALLGMSLVQGFFFAFP